MILATLSCFAQSGNPGPVKAVAAVDLNRYAGQWYEIARYSNKFQDQCVGNVTATYTLQGKGRIEVLNRCLKNDGTVDNAKGAAKLNDGDKSNAKLKVRFAPGFVSWLPQVWADYWVIDLANDYSYAVVATSDRKYFWVLSRKPTMEDATFQTILRRAEHQGFNPAKVTKTPQGVEAGKGSALTKS